MAAMMDGARAGARITEMPAGADLFKSDCQVLVNPTNCIGVSGALAGEFARRYPDMEDVYQYWCDMRWLAIGHPMLWANPRGGQDVLLFPTMFEPGSMASLRDIRVGLEYLADTLRCQTSRRGLRRFEVMGLRGISSVAFPGLGCGVGGLDWTDVRDLIADVLAPCDLTVELYPPRAATGVFVRSRPARESPDGVILSAGPGGDGDAYGEERDEPGREGAEDGGDAIGVLDFGE